MTFTDEDFNHVLAHVQAKWPKGCYQCGGNEFSIEHAVSFLPEAGSPGRGVGLIPVRCDACGYTPMLHPKAIDGLNLEPYTTGRQN